jgi:hypothetical protein
MPERGFWLLTGAVAALAPVPIVVAADYMSVETAQRELFSQADHFDEIVLGLNAAQKQVVTTLAGPQPPHRSLRCLEGYARR